MYEISRKIQILSFRIPFPADRKISPDRDEIMFSRQPFGEDKW